MKKKKINSKPSMATITKVMTPGQGNGVEAFFARCGYDPKETRHHCWVLLRNLYPDEEIEEASPQGYCSYTVCVGLVKIVQFRPPVHKLHMAIANAACETYGGLAPRTQHLTILNPPRSLTIVGPQPLDEGVVLEDDQEHYFDVLSLERIRGISLAEWRTKSSLSNSQVQHQQQQHQHRCSLIRHFARFIATGCFHADAKTTTRSGPGSTPSCPIPDRIGRSMRWRLEQMCASLPPRFKPFLSRTLNHLDEITSSLPWVLTHGDIVPANIMVMEPQSSSVDSPEEEEEEEEGGNLVVMTGLLDWAEAEYLPFGVGLYGLEELLGETDGNGRFEYYPEEKELRDLFWSCLEAELAAGGLTWSSFPRDTVDDAHALGVLLWHGIAFDNGKLDRVVQEGRDDEEILRLDLFFAGRSRRQ